MPSSETLFIKELSLLKREILELLTRFEKLEMAKENYLASTKRQAGVLAKRENRELEAEIKKLRATKVTGETGSLVGVEKAITLSIFDAIIDQIGYWSKTRPIADDFVASSRAFLYPVVYERVMAGVSDYYLESVPEGARDMVLLGRGFVEEVRDLCPTLITEPEAWDDFHPRGS